MENETKKKNYADAIIKVVLVLIIIALLIHNCTLMKEVNDGKDKKPDTSGNVNIIEIKCDKQCKIIKPDKQTDGDKEPTGDKQDSKQDGGNNKGNDSSKSNPGEEGSGSEETPEEPEVPSDEMEVFDDDYDYISWNGTTNLNIFSNSIYTVDGVIAPESSNTYQFVVKNGTAYKLKYEINFTETNPNGINMKFKLKKNNTYLVDHYVSYDELNINNQLLNSGENDTFYLEWKWISSDNDNNIGKNGANYQMKIEVNAEGTND